MRQTIYLDECGFTGEDLANPDAPVFVVASHDLDETTAKKWKERFFGHVAADELKHSQLQRRESHHKAVEEFLMALLAGNHVQAAMAHKGFALVAKLVDWVLDPMLCEAGFDIYEDRANVGLSSVLFFLLNAGDTPQLGAVTSAFQRAVRTRDPVLIGQCNTLLLSAGVQRALDDMGSFFQVAVAKQGIGWGQDLPERVLSLSGTVALAVCYSWRHHGMTSFDVVHDRSSAMAKERWMWDLMLSKEAPPAVVGHADFQVTFPIGVETTRFEDSHGTVALQLADVAAGAIGRWATWLSKDRPDGDRYARRLDEILDSYAPHVIDSSVWPTRDVAPRPLPPGVTSPLAYLATALRSRDS